MREGVVITVLILLVTGAILFAAPASLRVGAARLDITPAAKPGDPPPGNYEHARVIPLRRGWSLFQVVAVPPPKPLSRITVGAPVPEQYRLSRLPFPTATIFPGLKNSDAAASGKGPNDRVSRRHRTAIRCSGAVPRHPLRHVSAAGRRRLRWGSPHGSRHDGPDRDGRSAPFWCIMVS